MDDFQRWHEDVTVERAAAALARNGFSVVPASDGDDARARILGLVDPGETAAFGGSMTLGELGVRDALQARGQKMLLQTPGMSREEVFELRRRALLSDVYLASPNAVTLDGMLLFMDKIGNRAAAMMFGPRKVIAVAGANKIVPDESAGWQRIRQTAGPVNSRRLGLSTPCASSGVCADCAAEQRICNAAVTLRKRPSYTEYHVVLVRGEYGY